MPVFTPFVSPYERKKDKKHRVYIHIHVSKTDKTNLDTGIYVVKQQLNKDMQIKDRNVLRVVLDKIKECEDIILSSLGSRISSCSAEYIKNFLEKKLGSVSAIDFIEFSRKYISDLLETGNINKKHSTDRNKKEKRAKHIQTSLNAFVDKFGNKFDITTLTSDDLRSFEKYLRSPRTIIRLNQFGDSVKTKRKPLTDTGVHDYMTDIKLLFTEAQKKYNDLEYDIIAINNNPFAKYKIPDAGKPKSHCVDVGFIKSIHDYNPSGIREKLARDMYLLSFFLIGINSVDLFEMKSDCIRKKRLEYRRSKTSDRRDDEAFISIKIEKEAMMILKKYLDPDKKRLFSFHHSYADADAFNKAINIGLLQIRKKMKIKNTITYYSARHAWATIVRNSLGYSKYIVAECLNHVVDSLKVTDRYIQKEFAWMDEINRKVIDYVLYNNAGK